MKRKSVIISIVLIIVIVLLIGMLYKSKKEVNLNESFKLKVNESVSIKDENLKITLVSAKDNTCSDDVQCIQQGEINYTVIVNTETIEFGTELNKEKSYNNYKLIIDDDNNSIKYLKMKVEKNRRHI